MGRVLVVEDSVELAENLSDILEARGHRAIVVHDAERALDMLLEQPFDGVLTDLRLPGLSGVDLLERARARGLTLPIILMTAVADDGVMQQALVNGARAVIFKPFDLRQLFELLSAFDRATPLAE